MNTESMTPNVVESEEDVRDEVIDNEVEDEDEGEHEEDDEIEEDEHHEDCLCDDCMRDCETDEEHRKGVKRDTEYRKYRLNHVIYRKHEIAAENGDLSELIKLEKKTGTTGNYFVCSLAASKGHLHIVEYMVSQGLELNKHISFKACTSGNIPLLKYLHENKCPWDEECTLAAIEGEHVEALKYLLEQDAPRDDSALLVAIAYGNLEIIKLLHSYNYELLEEHVRAVFIGYDEDIYSSCRCKEKDEETYLEILKYLLSHVDCKNPALFRMAISGGKLKIAKWLVDNGYPTVYVVNTRNDHCEYFQHRLGITGCNGNCGFCGIKRIKMCRKSLYSDKGYGTWLSSDIIERLIDGLY